MFHLFYILSVFGIFYMVGAYASTSEKEVFLPVSVVVNKEELLPSLEIIGPKDPVIAAYDTSKLQFEDIIIPFDVTSESGYGITYLLSVVALATDCSSSDSSDAERSEKVLSETSAKLNGIPITLEESFAYTRVNIEHQLSLSVKVVNESVSPIICQGYATVTARLEI